MLPDDRQVAIIRLLADVLADCPVCDGPVRRCDHRALRDDRLLHLACAEGTQ